MLQLAADNFRKRILWVWVIAIVFVAVNTLALAFEFFYVPLLSVALLFVMLAFTRLDVLVYIIVFFAPISIPLTELVNGLQVDLYLPTEPLLAGVLIIYALKYFSKDRGDLKILRHPVTLAIYVHLAWMAVTIITSSVVLVSLKYLILRLWLII